MSHNTCEIAAYTLAIAICELFPNAQLVHSHVRPPHLAYDIFLEHPLDEQALSLISEKIGEIRRRKTPIETLEMVAHNARELFLHQKQFIRAKQLVKGGTYTLKLVRVGNFYELCETLEAPLLSDTGLCGAIHLEGVSHHCIEGDNLARISAIAQPDQKSLKNFLKRAKKGKEWDHVHLGKRLKLFLPENSDMIWLAKGAKLREQLLRWWGKQHEKRWFQPLYTPPLTSQTQEGFPWKMQNHLFTLFPKPQLSRSHYYSEQSANRRFCHTYFEFQPASSPFDRGLFHLPLQTREIAISSCPSKQIFSTLTSSLQFIKETINMFGFEHDWYLVAPGRQTGDNALYLEKCLLESKQAFTREVQAKHLANPRIEVRMSDAYGEKWSSSWIEVERDKNAAIIKHSLFGVVEWFIALLLENHHGFFPMWLTPEHARIIAASERNVAYAQKVMDELFYVGGLSQMGDPSSSVSQNVSAALGENVPYIVVIGDKEEQTDSVTIRQSGKSNITKTKQSFIEEIATKIEG